MSAPLDNAVAIVTGGGVGLGRGICLELAAAGAGAIVVNYAHSAAEAEETAEQLVATGVEALAMKADVSVESEARALVAETARRFAAVDLLVNNAGVSTFIPHPDLEAVDDEVWRRILGVNLMGSFYCSRAAGPSLREARGAIVNIASISGFRGVGACIPYAVSKAAVLQLTRSLAIALAPEVRVNSVTPGAVNTQIFGELFGERADEQAEALGAVTPLGRIATPQDIGRAVAALAGPGFATGQNLVVDGGKHLAY